ncbi:hypothetical protein SAMN05421638_2221 [Kaistella treverensis]|uniref:Uncharacterized protein n=1 Tax=Kaistella treverensis TaxID=631455 RepID=A0A1I3NTA5_9FLAO|nr:hypothetical protein SAMN05421638_2221 [Kaistella treverensis]
MCFLLFLGKEKQKSVVKILNIRRLPLDKNKNIVGEIYTNKNTNYINIL